MIEPVVDSASHARALRRIERLEVSRNNLLRFGMLGAVLCACAGPGGPDGSRADEVKSDDGQEENNNVTPSDPTEPADDAPRTPASERATTSTLSDYACSGLEDPSDAPQPAPSTCVWAEALDSIVVGEIASVAANLDRYSVSYWAVDALEGLIRENNLEGEFPWLDEMTAISPDERTAAAIVSSCPDGLRVDIDSNLLAVSVRPAITMRLKNVRTIFGEELPAEIEFFAPEGYGLRVDEGGRVQREGVLEDGTTIGVGLTRNPDTGSLVQGSQVPFTFSNGTVVAGLPCRPRPPLPGDLDGIPADTLEEQLAACAPNGARSAEAVALQAQELSLCFSGEAGAYCDAAQCFLNYNGELPE